MQQPCPVSDVAPDLVDPPHCVHVVDLLADARSVTELADSRGARLAGGHAPRDVLVGFDRQVRFELCGPLIVPPRAMKEAAKAHAGLSTRSIARTSSCHRDVCAESWRRPAGVRR